MKAGSDQLVAQLEWEKLSEWTWADLVARGLPRVLADLGLDLSERRRRRIRVFTIPTAHAGISCFAVPFLDDDGILLDPSLLEQPQEMGRGVAHGLASMLYPAWSNAGFEQYDQMHSFALALGPVLLREAPRSITETEPMVAFALSGLPTS